MVKLSDIITDAEIDRVHGNANFGYMDKRDVVNEGVAKIHLSYSCGYTQEQILIGHGLVFERKGRSPKFLKPKGKRYFAAMQSAGVVSIHPTLGSGDDRTP